MNHYPSWWDTKITLYNKLVDEKTNQVRWFRHILENCFYKHTLDKVTINKTTLSSNTSICRIPVSDKFKTKTEWIELTDEEREEYFTLCDGDIIIADEVDFEINEYEKSKRSSDLIKKYSEWPGCFIIEVVNINVGGGRGNEHYRVGGM